MNQNIKNLKRIYRNFIVIKPKGNLQNKDFCFVNKVERGKHAKKKIE